MNRTGQLLEKVLESVETVTSVEPWTPKILFENCYIQEGRKKQTTKIHSSTDILSFNPDDMKRDFKIYFDLEKYHAKSDFKKLVTDLKSACIQSGFSINQNGSNSRKGLDGLPMPIYRFACSHCKQFKYSGKKKVDTDPRSQPKGRKRTMICDRKNCRSDGKSLPRQTSTFHGQDACTFSFEVCFDGSGFVFEPPIGNKQIHQGHNQLKVHEIILRKSEVTDRIQDRMIEDSGVAMSIAGTHRVLNMITNHDGPFIAKSLVRSYRASNILRSHVDGTIVDTKGKDEMDQILELLSKNEARVTYLSVKPFQSDKKKIDQILLSSSPTNEEVPIQGSYSVRCKGKTLGIHVMGQGHPYLVVTKIDRKSSLFGLVSIGDRVLSMNGKSLEHYSISKFVDYVASLADEVKTLRMQRKNSPSVHDSHQPKSLEERQLCESLTYRNGGGKIFTKEMQEELEKIARTYRKDAMDPNTDMEMFLCLAWICPFSHSVANLHANTVMVDTTFNVCRFTNYRQFSVCVKSTDGKVYTVARIGVPHEKSAILAWVIECCIPSLLTELFPRRVNCIISDGDPHLCNAIENSLRTTYTSSIRLRCGYHICTRSWINNIERSLEYHDFVPEDVKQDFTKLILNWIYSWMRPSVDSSAEFEVSKDLLFAWLLSADVVENVCNESNAAMIIRWIRESILPYQEQFLFYRRKTIFNMDNYTTCPVEGTHRALKGNAIRVERTDTLPVYVKKATDYDAMKARDMQAKVVQNLTKTYLYGKGWMNNLIERGALLTFNMIQHSEYYVSQFLDCMDGLPIFVVLCDLGYDEDTAVLGDDPMSKEATTEQASKRESKYAEYTYEVPTRHPKFRHAWKVLLQRTVDGEYYLVCECMLWKRCGMPCTHCYHVYNKHLKPHSIFMDFDYHCFKVQWWKVTDYLIHKKPSTLTDTERDLLEKLMELAVEDVKGVRLHVCDNITDSNILKVQWDKDLCRGDEVRDEATLDPVKVASMGAAERLLGWKLPEKGVQTEFGLVPTQRNIDFSRSNGLTLENNGPDETVNVRKHEECKKDLTTMLYDICDKVHFPSNELFFSRLKRSLDDYHTEAINIAMSNMSNERGNGSQRTFAGVVGHNSSSKKIHAFSSPKKKKRMTKNTITSP